MEAFRVLTFIGILYVVIAAIALFSRALFAFKASNQIILLNEQIKELIGVVKKIQEGQHSKETDTGTAS